MEISLDSRTLCHLFTPVLDQHIGATQDSDPILIGKSKFVLRLYPGGQHDGNVVDVGLYLLHEGADREKVEFTLKIKKQTRSLIKTINKQDSSEYKQATLVHEFHNDSMGFANMISRQEIMKYIFNNSLLVECKITFVKSNQFNITPLKLLLNQELSDATIKVNDDVFPVHKMILCLRSPVFMQQFLAPTVVTTNQIVIDDFASNVVKVFLTCLYSNDCDMNKYDEAMSIELCKIADKYEVEQLKNICEVKLMSIISVENCFQLLHVADNHTCARLKDKAVYFTATHMKAALKNQFAFVKNLRPALLEEISDWMK